MQILSSYPAHLIILKNIWVVFKNICKNRILIFSSEEQKKPVLYNYPAGVLDQEPPCPPAP